MKNKIKEKKIVREGYKLICKHGYTGTSIEMVINSLEINKGLFYSYFKNKEDFAEAVLLHYVKTVLNRMDRTLYDYSISPKQRLVKLYSDHIDLYANSGNAFYPNFISSMYRDLGNTSQKIKELLADYQVRILEFHVDCIRAARRSGEVDKHQDPIKLAKLIISSWEGATERVTIMGSLNSLFTFREIVRDYLLK